jgi:superfamily I DNA/RNA helicase
VAEGGEPDEKMVLSSVHQAKGLEWRAVFLVWLADGWFPSAQALRDRDGEEGGAAPLLRRLHARQGRALPLLSHRGGTA